MTTAHFIWTEAWEEYQTKMTDSEEPVIYESGGYNENPQQFSIAGYQVE